MGLKQSRTWSTTIVSAHNQYIKRKKRHQHGVKTGGHSLIRDPPLRKVGGPLTPGPPRIAATSNNIDFYWNFRVALTPEKSSIFVETSRKKNWRGDAPMSCPMYLFPPLATPLRFKCNRNFVSIHPRITSVASERRRRRGRSPPQCWNHGNESIFSPPQYFPTFLHAVP